MNIVHIGLASKFTENMTYQDNLLSEQNALDGHTVTYIADCYRYEDGKLVKTEAEDKMLTTGVRLIRLQYIKIINDYISEKIRAVRNLYQLLENLKPDVILFHGLQSYELNTAIKYKKHHSGVKIYCDCHEDFNNSATNFISKIILHKGIYKNIILKNIFDVDKILTVSFEGYRFLHEMYEVPLNLIEDFPLGGTVVGLEKQLEYRKEIRLKLGIKETDIVITHSGKMDKLKKTDLIIKAMKGLNNTNIKLLLVGSIDKDLESSLINLISNDSRIRFLGWKNAEELIKLLCATDLYLQPGSQSATMQNAMCCGAAVCVAPHENYKHLLGEVAMYAETEAEIKAILINICNDQKLLSKKKKEAKALADSKLDYKKLAERLYK